jgi:hypothetical protein
MDTIDSLAPIPFGLLQKIRDWLDDSIQVRNPKVARFYCSMIPGRCPFERDIYILGQKIAHIPPLCKLNPLYEPLLNLRFRALCYLADHCNEDIRSYC